ncbi:MAG: rhodanese-like domain-containing protein [Tepidisphaerales bacterium]
MRITRTYTLLVVAMVLVAGALPLVLYWLTLGRLPTVRVPEAQQLLATQPERYALVDVRTPAEYETGHLDRAANWPLDQILALSAAQVPPHLAGRRLLLFCNSGWRSGMATQHLNALSPNLATNIRGGMQEWIAEASPSCPVGMALAVANGSTTGLPHKNSPAVEQWAAVVTGFAVKPVYMLLSLAIAGVLLRSRAADLVALRWSMILFFLGELACLLDYIFYADRSLLFEYLHNYGMILAFAFAAWAAMETLDTRIVAYSAPTDRCAFLHLCGRCIKHTDAPCGLRRLFLLLLPAAAVVATVPLSAPYRTDAYNTRIFGTTYAYLHEVIHQMYEIRFLPVLAVVLFAASFLVLWLFERHPVGLSKILFAAGVGAMGFSFFRLILQAAFHQNQVWHTFWEEITEFLFTALAAATLWIFRERLFEPSRPGDKALRPGAAAS